MANGEAYRQEVGVISSGSYQNHFLLDLSDEERERQNETERKEDRRSKKSGNNNIFKCEVPCETCIKQILHAMLR